MTKPLERCKNQYQALQQSLIDDFSQNPDEVESLVKARSDKMDALLTEIWQIFAMDDSLCLVAVGGYGRAELHLHSDIDLLLLLPAKTHQQYQQKISKFLTFLWDIGLEVGHSTRDIQDCIYAIKDLTVVTNLLESRFLIGQKSLFLEMKNVIKTSDWSLQSFFVQKQKEQRQRHLNFSNTAYNLEPNLKESPGGLRDIQTHIWIAKWYFEADCLADLVDKGYFSENEYHTLKQGRLFLWKVRFALHIIAKRGEERLAFQYQKSMALMLGYENAGANSGNMAVESFMKDYYQTLNKISRLNDILLQILENRALHTQTLNSRFIIKYGYIEIIEAQVFSKHPQAFIEIFLLIAQNNYVHGIGADTLRKMQIEIDIMDENYHKKRQNNQLFIKLLQQKQGVNKALKLMNRYGILERYIPVFGKIVGLMQYDLFHAYTVDQHILFVVRNLRRFFVADFAKEFSLCSEIATTIDKPELLLLAALFHDIGKGQGGNHAKLGSDNAVQFCQQHQLKPQDTEMISGLVEQHLLMSQTAQKLDIDDFEVIDNFAKKVGSIRFLEFLYLLTVADIRATKDDLWNGWKDALLKKLFYKTKSHLQAKTPKPLSVDKQIKAIKQSLLTNLREQGYENKQIEPLLLSLPKEYFLRYQTQEMLWHFAQVTKYYKQKIVVDSKISDADVVDIFIYCDNKKGLFFSLMSIIEKMGLYIVDAKIMTTKDKKAYNTISVLANEILGQISIDEQIQKKLNQPPPDITPLKHLHQHFEQQMKINFCTNEKWNLTQVDINIIDKQGLLSNIAYVFYQLDINLINARITTLGERVEDIFFVSNNKNQPLDKNQQTLLKKALEQQCLN